MATMTAGFNLSVGEKDCHIEGGLMNTGLIGGVGIADIVRTEDDRFRVFALDDNAGTEPDGVTQSLVRDGDAVEIRLLVKLNDTLFGDGVAIDDEGCLRKTDSETQGPFVENLVFAEDVGHDDAVAKHQGGSAAT